MKKTTLATKKSASKKVTAKTSKAKKPVAIFTTSADLRSALLVISLLANLFVLCLWITLQVTSQYDASLSEFFLNHH